MNLDPFLSRLVQDTNFSTNIPPASHDNADNVRARPELPCVCVIFGELGTAPARR
jgi:hypothetical protein